MAQYDGSIRINTEINTRNASAQLMSLENRITKTADKIASLRSKMDALKEAKVPTQEYKEVAAQIEKAEQKFNKLLEKQEQMQREGKDNGVAWERLQAQIEEVGNEIRYAQGELQDLVDTGKAFTLGTDTQEYAKMEQQLRYLQNDYDVLIQRRNEFEQRHGGGDSQVSGYERLQSALQGLRERLSAILHPIESMRNAFSSAASSMKEKAAGIAASIINGITHPLQTLRPLASSVASGISKVFSGMISATKKAGSAIGSLASKLKSAASSMFSLRNGTGSANNMFKASIGNILKYGLGIRSLYALISKFRTGVKEGFQNLAQYSSPVNAAISSLMSALAQLKNSLATAFAPILTAVAPALTTLINLISKAVTAVGMLIAALTGKSTFVKATKVQQNYAASLGNTAGAAKKAGKAVKKAGKEAAKSLAAFDKLNVLDKNDSDDSGGGGGAGGGGGGGIGGIGDMFETVDIPSKIKDFADMLKKAWKDADFTEIGAIIGKKLKEGLEKIPWDDIKAVAAKIGKSLATLINGFVEVPGLGYTIGKTFAEAINTALTGLEAFAKNLHWDSVGKFIADGINGVLENIDWDTALSAAKLFGAGIATALNNALTEEVFENIGYTIGMGVNTALEFAESFLDTFDWSSFGSNIATGLNKAINTIDWEKLGRVIGKLLNAFFKTFGSFAEKFDWSGFGKSVGTALTTAIKTFDWANAGTSIAKFVNGLFKSIKSFVDNTDWKGLGKGITTAISNFFSEFDWGTVSGTISSFLIGLLDFFIGLIEGIDWSSVPQGIIDAISDFLNGFDYAGVFGKIGELIGTAVAAGIDLLKALKEVLENAWDSVVDYFSGYIEDSGGNIIEGLYNGIVDAIKDIGTWVKTNIVDPFVDGFKNALGIHSPSTVMAEQGGYIIDGLLKGITDAWDGFIKSVSDLWDEIVTTATDVFDSVSESVETAWDEIKSKTTETWESVKTTASTTWENVKSTVSTAATNASNSVKTSWESIKSKTATVWDSVKTKISNTWSNTKSTVSTAAANVKESVKNAWETVKSKTTSTWDSVKSKISTAWDNAKKSTSTKVAEIKNVITNTFSNIGTLMSNIGKDIVNGLINGIKSVWSKITGIAGNIKDAITGAVSGSKASVSGASVSSAATYSVPYSAIETASLDIPKLANGAVIRGGDPFMAVLGDQPRGQTNIETPLSTMVSAFKQAMAETGGAGCGDITIQAILDGKIMYENTVKRNDIEFKRTGRNRLAH